MSLTAHAPLTFPQPLPRSTSHAPRRSGLTRRIVGTLRLWLRRIREREALRQLGPRELRDIGITPADVYWEIKRPFWLDSGRG